VFAERTVVRAVLLGFSGHRPGDAPRRPLFEGEPSVITLGIILLILGIVLGIGILQTLGIILLVIGAVLFLLGAAGRAVGGRRHYY
jgi:hypothetical protein